MKTFNYYLLSICLFIGATTSLQAQSKKAIKLYEKGVEAMEEYLYVKATVDFTNAIARDPAYVDAYYQRGISFAGMEQYEAAIRDYKKVIELDPGFLMAYLNQILVHKRLNQYEQAFTCIGQLEENIPDLMAVGLYHRGRCYEEMEKPVKAIEQYEKALGKMDPEKDPNFKELMEDTKARIADLKKKE